MSALSDAAADYLAIRRALGHKLVETERRLTEFTDFLEARGEVSVSIDAAVMWSASAASAGLLARRLSMVRGFAAYLAAFDPATQIPPQHLVSTQVVRRAPYIFSADEVTALMAAARIVLLPPFAATFSTLVGLMAATGIRTAEMKRLDCSDVDLQAGLLSIRHSKYGKSRRVPLHPSTVLALTDYLQRRDEICLQSDQSALFVSATGRRLSGEHTAPPFRRLLDTVGISVLPGRRSPRLHDLRHTFAVTTLIDWHVAGVDVLSRLPLLSLYLGHVNPAHTYWYLSGVPELMGVLADRLEAFLGSET